jgi:DNA primase
VVAPQGTAFTEGQARILKRYVNEVVLCFDADAAGQKAAERSLEPLLQNDLVVRIAEMPEGEDPDSLVRKEGAKKFSDRISAARDFFDFWIENVASKVDLTSLSAKMQLARELAETVARVRDPLMRNEVISKITARLGVSGADFSALLPKMQRRPGPEEMRPRIVAPAPRHEIAMLCLLALRDAGARNFLLTQDWQEVVRETPGTEILSRILASNLRPDEPASLNVFMSSLSPGEESLVSGWLLQRMPPNAEAVARDWWQGLRQPALRRRVQEMESRLKLPQLSAQEVVALQKQVVDLRAQLDDFSRFSPSPAPDS